MGDDLDVCSRYMFICLYEMVGHNGGKKLRRGDGMLLRHEIDGVLDGVGCDDSAVISFGVTGYSQLVILEMVLVDWHLRGFDFTFKEHAHGHLNDRLGARLLITVDFVDTNVVLAIAGS